MGAAWSTTQEFTQSIYHRLIHLFSEPRTVLICGLDNAGKTCLVNTLQNISMPTVPTLGFNADTFKLGQITLKTFDVCGQNTRRGSWAMFYKHCDALIYVVDSNDIERIYEAGTELIKIRSHQDFPDIPMLILANKQDQPHAATPAQVMRGMRLNNETRPWRVAGTVIKDNEGIYDPLEWLLKQT